MSSRSIVVVASIALVVPACLGQEQPDPPGPAAVSQADADGMIGGLCEMSGELRGEVVAGRTVFYDSVHERLHRVAAEVEMIDTALAGALLEAKQLVEADLESAAAPTDYGDHVDGLLAATQDAVVLLGLTDPGCAR